MTSSEEIFARVETKYMLDFEQASMIENALEARGFKRMVFGSPRVQSLYYDTPDDLLIRQSLERPVYKEKLRFRAYGEPGKQTLSFVEIKKKYNHVVYKRRTALSLEDAADVLDPMTPSSCPGQIGREVDWMVRRYSLRPRVIISYDRDAYIHPDDPDVRITLDRNIAFRDDALDLRLNRSNTPLILPNQRLMEIKTPGTYPLWLLRIIQDAGARRSHYSKYGDAYSRFLAPRLQDSNRKGA